MYRSELVTHYSSGSRFFHWLIALLVLGMLAVGFFLDEIPDQFAATAYMVHKSLGLSILLLVILRIIWLIKSGRPPLPENVPLWEKLLSRLVQYSMYLFLILMPLSGWIMSVAADRTPSYFGFFNVPFPGVTPDKSLSDLMFEFHETIAWILIVLIVLHVAGALKHHFIDRDDVLRKMLPGSKK